MWLERLCCIILCYDLIFQYACEWSVQTASVSCFYNVDRLDYPLGMLICGEKMKDYKSVTTNKM